MTSKSDKRENQAAISKGFEDGQVYFKKMSMSDLPHCAEHLREFLLSFEADIVERKDDRIQGQLHVVTGDIIESGSMLDSSHKSDESEGGVYILLLWLGCSSDMF